MRLFLHVLLKLFFPNVPKYVCLSLYPETVTITHLLEFGAIGLL